VGAYLGVLTVLFWRLALAFARYRIRRRYTTAVEPPSVSICIPARNEMHALTQCLERVLASSYPKLEVIVFDDESVDETSIIIKSFAQAGVRFVPGQPLPDDWLGRNRALDVLAREASGTYVIFMDVDTFIQPDTINELVGFMTSEKATMMSVIPRREDVSRASVLFGTLRYFWQVLSLAKDHASASSSLWMIKRAVLIDKLDGFHNYKNTVELESAVAHAVGEDYRCLIGNDELGISYEKKWRSQVETARRLLYPHFGGDWYGALSGLSLLLFLNAPTVIVTYFAFIGWGFIATMAITLQLIAAMLYGFYLYHVWQRNWWLGAFLWPIVIMQELILFVESLWGYLSRNIIWKGRSVMLKQAD
jgi:glycosyltransferase involved in cell wall biosynthesis